MKRYVIIFIGLMSAALYDLLGNAPRLQEIAQWQARIIEARDIQTPTAWAELGRAYMQARDFADAAQAYKQAVVHSGGAVDLILRYAEALIFAADGNVTDDAARALDAVLQQGPNDEARYFSALRKLQQGDTQTAMRDMKALYRSLPQDAPLRHIINRQIGRE